MTKIEAGQRYKSRQDPRAGGFSGVIEIMSVDMQRGNPRVYYLYHQKWPIRAVYINDMIPLSHAQTLTSGLDSWWVPLPDDVLPAEMQVSEGL